MLYVFDNDINKQVEGEQLGTITYLCLIAEIKPRWNRKYGHEKVSEELLTIHIQS